MIATTTSSTAESRTVILQRMNMRDQLKKAKLLSDKQAKQLAHSQRVERKEKGREQLEQEAQTLKDVTRAADDQGGNHGVQDEVACPEIL